MLMCIVWCVVLWRGFGGGGGGGGEGGGGGGGGGGQLLKCSTFLYFDGYL